MAVIIITSMTGFGNRVVTPTILGASDTLVYSPLKNPILILKNETAGPLTPVITGADATTVACAGIEDITVSGGFTFTAAIAAMTTVAIPLNTIKGYLEGIITITAGDALEAHLLEF